EIVEDITPALEKAQSGGEVGEGGETLELAGDPEGFVARRLVGTAGGPAPVADQDHLEEISGHEAGEFLGNDPEEGDVIGFQFLVEALGPADEAHGTEPGAENLDAFVFGIDFL